MPNRIPRRSIYSTISPTVTLASADDLDGTLDGTQYVKLNGRQRLLIFQVNDGTLGTAGIDVIEVSHDGAIWIPDPTLMLGATNEVSLGTLVSGAALNAAGVEPVNHAVFKSGPHSGFTLVRCGRKTTSSAGTTWVTGAPSVYGIVIG